MSLDLDKRQRAMLREMGVQVWSPLPETAQAAAAPTSNPPLRASAAQASPTLQAPAARPVPQAEAMAAAPAAPAARPAAALLQAAPSPTAPAPEAPATGASSSPSCAPLPGLTHKLAKRPRDSNASQGWGCSVAYEWEWHTKVREHVHGLWPVYFRLHPALRLPILEIRENGGPLAQ